MSGPRGISRRRFLGTAAAAGVAAGCGVLPDGTVQSFVPTTELDKVRLSVWGDVSDAAIYTEILDAWHSSQNKYRAVMEQYTGDYYAKILANFAGSIPADVMYFQGWKFQAFAESDVLLPLDDFIERDGMQSRWPATDAFRWHTEWKGATYMAPSDGGSLVAFYNKAMFDKRGIPYPTADWTWDDFKEMVPELTYTESGKQYYGFAQAGGWLGGYSRFVPFLRRNGYLEWDQVIEPHEARWDHEDISSALQFAMVDTIKNGWSPGPSAVSGGGISFATGQIGVMLEGPWYLPNLYGELATTPEGIPYEVTAPPKGTDGRIHSTAFIHGHVIARQSRHKEGAWDLIKFITGDEGQRIVAKGGRMCAHPDKLDQIWAPIATKSYNFTNSAAFRDGIQSGETPVILGEGARVSSDGGEILDAMWTGLQSAKQPATSIVSEYQPQIQGALDDYWSER